MKIKQALKAVVLGLLVLVQFLIEFDMVWRWWHGRDNIGWALAGLLSTGYMVVLYRDALIKWFPTDKD